MDIAVKHVGHDGCTYTPGEVIDGLSDEQRNRLLRKKAIRVSGGYVPEVEDDDVDVEAEEPIHNPQRELSEAVKNVAEEPNEGEAAQVGEEDEEEAEDLSNIMSAEDGIVDDPEPKAETATTAGTAKKRNRVPKANGGSGQ